VIFWNRAFISRRFRDIGSKRIGVTTLNVEKCKIMVSNDLEDDTAVISEGAEVELVEDFWYPGSNISRLVNCNKECKMRIRKASSVFGRLANIWKSKSISLPVKIKLYESLANFNTNVRRRVMATSSHTDEKESPAIADKPARRESMPKLLKFDVLTTSSLTILVYIHTFSCCCVRNLRNPEKFFENANL